MIGFRCMYESARRGSNPRPPPWQGGAPPLSHSRTRPIAADKKYCTIWFKSCQHSFAIFVLLRVYNHDIIGAEEKQAAPKATFVFPAVQAVRLEHSNEQASCEAGGKARKRGLASLKIVNWNKRRNGIKTIRHKRTVKTLHALLWEIQGNAVHGSVLCGAHHGLRVGAAYDHAIHHK